MVALEARTIKGRIRSEAQVIKSRCETETRSAVQKVQIDKTIKIKEEIHSTECNDKMSIFTSINRKTQTATLDDTARL